MQAIEPSPRDPSRAWESAFATHYCGLCDYVLRFVGSADAAQDLVQDLFLHLWDTRGPRDAVRLTRGYLYVAARNRALKYLRHRRVADAWADRAAREEPPSPAGESPEDWYLQSELDRAVQHAIAGLPERCREIFLLRRLPQGVLEVGPRPPDDQAIRSTAPDRRRVLSRGSGGDPGVGRRRSAPGRAVGRLAGSLAAVG